MTAKRRRPPQQNIAGTQANTHKLASQAGISWDKTKVTDYVP